MIMNLWFPFLIHLSGEFNHQYWMFRLEMCDFCCSFLKENVEALCLLNELIGKFARSLVGLMGCASSEFAPAFLRSSIGIHRL
jgi:hypothetical protein